MPGYINLTGKRFGRLTVLRPAENIGTITAYVCACDCGNEKTIRSNALRSGKTKSCGCLLREKAAERCRNAKTTNEYEFQGAIVIGKLNCGKTFIIDFEDYDKIKDIKWSTDNNEYVRGHAENGKRVLIHRLIMSCPDGMVVDHINHNPLDNRKSNLRICAQKDNAKNTRLRFNSKSGVTGVGYLEKNKKWRSFITVDYKTIHLGLFDKKEEAIEARKKAEIEYFKEFRCCDDKT